jgi:glucan phosphorylase
MAEFAPTRPQPNRPLVYHQAILNVAGMGQFSAERTIREYADDIWNVKPIF